MDLSRWFRSGPKAVKFVRRECTGCGNQDVCLEQDDYIAECGACAGVRMSDAKMTRAERDALYLEMAAAAGIHPLLAVLSVLKSHLTAPPIEERRKAIMEHRRRRATYQSRN